MLNESNESRVRLIKRHFLSDGLEYAFHTCIIYTGYSDGEPGWFLSLVSPDFEYETFLSDLYLENSELDFIIHKIEEKLDEIISSYKSD